MDPRLEQLGGVDVAIEELQWQLSERLMNNFAMEELPVLQVIVNIVQ